jgi:hypothetical protein
VQSRIPLIPKPANSASLRKGALRSVPSQRPMGKHRTQHFIPCRSAGIKGQVGRASHRSAKGHAQSAQVGQQRHGAVIARERAHHPRLTFP